MAEFLHEILSLTLVLLIVAVMLTVVAARLRIPYAVLLIIGGAILGFIPHLPYLSLDPNLVLLIFLPPLISFSAWFIS
ncbi:hypothetical protein KSC_024030 [Ktedonobacter sp. SOSP1-52]|uniref:hypothetical protein n=1 Tax=Ktedonobacter sp. SOSP1-52 TaxID=2778366 RepID=UPI001915B797|nr:hypothetical protein [Ktedonobacter sp. SOSP1-52]GHO63511.1 hypothetical protein KSC_024030 [Ktedonobacter sp. SOSP1-52]